MTDLTLVTTPTPTVADVLARKVSRSPTGARLAARNRGPRWVSLDIERLSLGHGWTADWPWDCLDDHIIPASPWPAATSSTMADLADKLSWFFVYSHSSGSCSVSSIDGEMGYLPVPSRCGDLFLAALIDAEQGDDRRARNLLGLVSAYHTFLASRSCPEQRRYAGRLVDEMAQLMLLDPEAA